MYKPKKIQNSDDIIEYIENNDVYNSQYIKVLDRLTLDGTLKYKRNKSDIRLDLISRSLYRNTDFISQLFIMNRLSKSDIPEIIKYMDEDDYSIISSISMK